MEAVFAVVEVEIEREIDWTPRLKSRHASNDFRTWLTLAAAADKFVNWISTFTIFSTPLAGVLRADYSHPLFTSKNS